jgi:hypothetical protein
VYLQLELSDRWVREVIAAWIRRKCTSEDINLLASFFLRIPLASVNRLRHKIDYDFNRQQCNGKNDFKYLSLLIWRVEDIAAFMNKTN